ncbi:hypothetical protein P20311_1239 [Pseudoalteromonas sp. BSi20311]|nr:hypothetical protein P20311_1239 [Pseudoalteromonas sp. BSi20311]GAA70022.1 hypothetical protein P20439_0084 [Pseudoalteromonas sp. BSi20439]
MQTAIYTIKETVKGVNSSGINYFYSLKQPIISRLLIINT